jgi:hypothetical protein
VRKRFSGALQRSKRLRHLAALTGWEFVQIGESVAAVAGQAVIEAVAVLAGATQTLLRQATATRKQELFLSRADTGIGSSF